MSQPETPDPLRAVIDEAIDEYRPHIMNAVNYGGDMVIECEMRKFALAALRQAHALQREQDAEIADVFAEEWAASPASMEGEAAAAKQIAATIRAGASERPRTGIDDGLSGTQAQPSQTQPVAPPAIP